MSFSDTEPTGEPGLELAGDRKESCLWTVGERYDVAESGRVGVLIVRTRSPLFKLKLEDERCSFGTGRFHSLSRV